MQAARFKPVTSAMYNVLWSTTISRSHCFSVSSLTVMETISNTFVSLGYKANAHFLLWAYTGLISLGPSPFHCGSRYVTYSRIKAVKLLTLDSMVLEIPGLCAPRWDSYMYIYWHKLGWDFRRNRKFCSFVFVKQFLFHECFFNFTQTDAPCKSKLICHGLFWYAKEHFHRI